MSDQAGETTNHSTHAVGAGGRWRTALAVSLIVAGLVLAPVATVAAWTRAQLVDTDRFVATLAPLADDPGVQDLVAGEIVAAIGRSVDIPVIVSDAADGVRSLGLPSRADAALSLLQNVAVQGARNVVDSSVRRIVASPGFRDVWTQALRIAHDRTTAVLQDDPRALARIGDDGTLSLDLGTLVGAVRSRMLDSGFALASAIPAVEGSVPLVTSDALVPARTTYTIAVTAGLWSPWVAAVLVITGVLLARRRLSALARTALASAVVFVALAIGLAVARALFVSAMRLSMPASTATTVFDVVASGLVSTVVALALLSGTVAVASWVTGSGPYARAVRGLGARAVASIRRPASGPSVQ